MGPAEGQHVPERGGETEAVYESESEHGHPAPAQSGRDDVLQRHVHDRGRDHCFNERDEPEGGGRQTQRCGDQRNRVRDREGGDEDHEYSQPLKGDNQAQQEQEVIHAVEDVGEAQPHEAKRGLVPAGIEHDSAGIPCELVETLATGGGQEAQYRRDPHPQSFQAGQDGKLRPIRRNPVFEQHIQHYLLPIDLCAFRKRRSKGRGQCGFVRSEGWVGREGSPDGYGFGQG